MKWYANNYLLGVLLIIEVNNVNAYENELVDDCQKYFSAEKSLTNLGYMTYIDTFVCLCIHIYV